tara:strand:+ start:144 stop:548 length:405 start_codon:yes stop_codon:yes gene_type:complete
MVISENKLRVFALSGIFYLIFLSLSNKNINILDLFINNITGVVIVFSIMYSISYVSFKLLNINSLGLGDIKLSSISSIWLGIESSFISLCISFLLSAMYSLHTKITRKSKPFDQYPFAPFISIGIFCSWILDKI